MAKKKSPNPPIGCSYSEIVDPKDLKPHPENPNEHPSSQIKRYKKIIQGNGWRRAITVSKQSGFVVKGHGALITALQSGWTQVPIDRQDYDSMELEIADLLADNELARAAVTNKEKLQELMHDFAETNFDTDLTGYTADSLGILFDEPQQKKKRQKKTNIEDALPEFVITVALKNEEDQKELFAELTERGLKCRLI